jgi:hypothetical protein
MWRVDDDGCGGWGARDASMARGLCTPAARLGGVAIDLLGPRENGLAIGELDAKHRSAVVVDGGIVAGVDDGEERERLSVAPRVEVVEPLADLECVGLAGAVEGVDGGQGRAPFEG